MNKDSLIEELQPFYEEGDCCSFIVELRKKCSVKDKEIERLNNIVNKLEEELEYRISYGEDEEGETYRLMTLEDKIILEKLQELKGSDK